MAFVVALTSLDTTSGVMAQGLRDVKTPDNLQIADLILRWIDERVGKTAGRR